MGTITRRNFLGAAAAAGALATLAACGTDTATTSSSSSSSAVPGGLPSADSYPLDPDGSDVEAKYTTEETRYGFTRYQNEDGPEIGLADTAKLIQVDGYAFRDMNGNGKLDLWEDWRQDADTRAAALAEAMPAEDIIPLLWHGGDEGFTMPGADADDSSSSETPAHEYCLEGSRAGVSRRNSTLDSYASDISWINEVQQVCEDSDWGIPYLNSTDQYQLFGLPDNIALGSTLDPDIWRKAGMWLGRAWHATGCRCLLGPQVDVYGQPLGCRFSGSVGVDPAINRDFTKAFAGGLQSTWGDDDATDDEGWGTDSVIAMLKHMGGEGCVEGGRNDHADPGRYNVFPGDNFDAQFIPFLDGGLHLDSKTGQCDSLMPCYGVAYDEDQRYGELVGAGYSKEILGIARNAGWDGMYVTDWQILNSETYGVGSLSYAERFAKMILAGEDQCGGQFMTDVFDESYKLMEDDLGEDGALERVRESARRIARCMIHVGLFEEPYSDPEKAKEVLESEEATAFALEASKKCIVMLKNHDNVISKDGLPSGAKVYLPLKKNQPGGMVWMMGGDTTPTFDPAFSADLLSGCTVVSDTDDGENVVTASDADLADVQYVIVHVDGPTDPNDGVTGGTSLMGEDTGEPLEYEPITLQYRTYTADGPNVRQESLAHVDEDGNYENRSYYGHSSTASNESDLDMVISLREKFPEAKIILLVEATRPMCFYEIEPYVDVILFSWTMQAKLQGEAWASVITGETEPTGVLNAQMPVDMDTVEGSCEDLPRDLDPYVDADGNAYDFLFGLDWDGPIDDERTAQYKADPLTKPETADVTLG